MSIFSLAVTVDMEGLGPTPATSLPCQSQARKWAKSLLAFDNCFPAKFELECGMLKWEGGIGCGYN